MRATFCVRVTVLVLAVWAVPGAAFAKDATAVLPDNLPFESERSIQQWRDSIVGPVEKLEGVTPAEMLGQYMVDQVDAASARWDETFHGLKTPEQIRARQKELRARFLEAIGGAPERTPLNAQVTGVLRRPGYRVEKVLFESQPRHYVTGALFVPESDAWRAPYPGVLVPCGHFMEGKAAVEYQSMGALLALSGMVGLVFDPIEQGERFQVAGSGVRCVDGHDAMGPGSILLGRNTTYFYLWDAVRALDYLASRPEVDPVRLGCTGNSGGGTQTLFLSSTDDRIIAAAPSCSMSRMVSKARKSPGDVEQHIFGQLAFGLDEPDYLMMRAPEARWFLCTATQDFVDIQSAWQAVRYAKRLYTRLGFPERLNLLEEDVPHSYGKVQREAVARWMTLWLRDENRVIEEPDIQTFTDEELWVTPQGRVMLLDGARTTYDLNEDAENELASVRARLWSETPVPDLLDRVRLLARIRKLQDLPPLVVDRAGTLEWRGFQAEKLVLRPEKGIYLPALLITAASGASAPRALCVDAKGKAAALAPGGVVEDMAKQGVTVLAVDLRGMGETATVGDRQDLYNYYRAHDLGRSLIGMQAEDVLWCARFLSEADADRGWSAGPVALVSAGNAGVAALHAAALEPGLFRAVDMRNGLVSWSNVVHTRVPENMLPTVVHGALRSYDLPDLARLLDGKLTTVQPMGANGRPLDAAALDSECVLLHRWRFDTEANRTSTDEAGGADAVLHGAAAVRDNALDLTANPDSADTNLPGAGWAELPIAQTLSSLDKGATFETWIVEGETHKQAELWSFGSTYADETYLWTEYGNGYSHVVTGIRTDKDAPWRNAYTIVPLAPGRVHHIVTTYYADAWTRELKLYIDGECVNRLTNPDMPSQIKEYANCFLGRHCSPPNTSCPLWNGRVLEFRLYRGALPYEQVQAHYAEGVDAAPQAAVSAK